MRKKAKSLSRHSHLNNFSSKPILIIIAEIIFGMALNFCTLMTFVYLAKEMMRPNSQTLDISLSSLVYGLRTPWLTQIMIFITGLGAEFTIAAAILICSILIWEKHRQEGILFVITFISGLAANTVIKMLFQRPRPIIAPLIVETSYSFPSGHTMNAIIFYGLFAYLTFHFTGNKPISRIVILCSIVLIGLIGFSRVYLGVHYPSDVLAGYLAGLCWLITAILIRKTMIFHELFQKYR